MEQFSSEHPVLRRAVQRYLCFLSGCLDLENITTQEKRPLVFQLLYRIIHYCLETSKNSEVYKKYCEVFLTQYRMYTLYRIKIFDSPYNTKFYFYEPLAQGLERK